VRYPFRCTVCGLEFEVSPASATPAPPSSGFSHHGHSHGAGTGHHSH